MIKHRFRHVGASVYRLLDDLCLHHHRRLRGFTFAILYDFRMANDLLATTYVLDECEGFIAKCDVVITLDAGSWREHRSERWRRALLDHELTHITVRYPGKRTKRLGVRPESINEFSTIWQRYGDWNDELPKGIKGQR